MWSDRKPWWQKKAGDNEGKHAKDLPYAKNWCVIKVARLHYGLHNWNHEVYYTYRAVGRSNAPQYYDDHGKLKKSIEVDNLTKHEAICVAKGLNFFDGEK